MSTFLYYFGGLALALMPIKERCARLSRIESPAENSSNESARERVWLTMELRLSTAVDGTAGRRVDH